MYVFWQNITFPLLTAVRPRTIVEIGSESGATTKYLLPFCRQTGAVLHSIDPAPLYDVTACQHEFGDHYAPHCGLSLDVLPSLPPYDVALVDGDHNWYTVINELRQIEKTATAANRPFPLTLLHDVGWPYGRRDMYYNPDTIPAEHRQPYARQGMLPGQSDLLPQGGINANLQNAVTEGTPRNGVLTGIEDFLKESSQQLEVRLVPGFHGLCILFPTQLRFDNKQAATVLDMWNLPAGVRQYVGLLEQSRLQVRLNRG